LRFSNDVALELKVEIEQAVETCASSIFRTHLEMSMGAGQADVALPRPEE